MSETFDSEDTEHLARRHETYIDAAGVISVGGVFDIILGKVSECCLLCCPDRFEGYFCV